MRKMLSSFFSQAQRLVRDERKKELFKLCKGSMLLRNYSNADMVAQLDRDEEEQERRLARKKRKAAALD